MFILKRRKGDIMQHTFGHTTLPHHWWHHEEHLAHEEPGLLMKIYCVRVLAFAVVSCFWVVLTLATGVLSMAMVMLIGLAVGNAHHLLAAIPRRAHLSSAILLTVCGGLLANVLAGLALYSSKVGVSYWQVLAARSIPEELPMLTGVFVDSYRLEDSLVYILAVGAAVLSARYLRSRHLH